MDSRDKNLHDGHRKRLREKFKTGKESFKEHELLELLLSYSLPRIDTNALAHSLINEFGSLKGVIEADAEVLSSVKGLGENTACFLSLINYLTKTLNKKEISKTKFSNISDCREHLPEIFSGYDHEVFLIVYLNKNNEVINTSIMDSKSKDSVLIDFTEITKGLLINKPDSVVIAHNHFAKYPKPSDADDNATEKIYALLKLYKVSFYDHLIVSGNEVYSYFYDNRLQKIKDKVDKNF